MVLVHRIKSLRDSTIYSCAKFKPSLFEVEINNVFICSLRGIQIFATKSTVFWNFATKGHCFTDKASDLLMRLYSFTNEGFRVKTFSSASCCSPKTFYSGDKWRCCNFSHEFVCQPLRLTSSSTFVTPSVVDQPGSSLLPHAAPLNHRASQALTCENRRQVRSFFGNQKIPSLFIVVTISVLDQAGSRLSTWIQSSTSRFLVSDFLVKLEITPLC